MKNRVNLAALSLVFAGSAFSVNSLADVATGITYNDTIECSTSKAQADELAIIYGTDDADRQWLNIYYAPGSAPKPVFLFAHANGGSACNINNQLKATIVSEGYTIVSWESHTTLTDPTVTSEAQADAFLAVDFLRENATELNLDMDNIIVAGRSRGSGASWTFAHSGDPAIKGLYMPQAMPDPFWEHPEEWDPAADVTTYSKPLYMPYKPAEADIDYDIHDPRRGLDIVDRYTELGNGDQAQVVMGVEEDALYDYFPTFLASLSNQTEQFSDDFSGQVLNSVYESQSGTWGIQNQALVNNDSNSVGGLVHPSEWDNSSISVDLKTLKQRDAGSNGQVAGVLARYTDSANYYELALKVDGRLVLKSVKQGISNILMSTNVGLSPFDGNNLSMSLQGSQIEVSINNTVIGVVNDSDHVSGKTGVKTVFSQGGFDNLSITEL